MIGIDTLIADTRRSPVLATVGWIAMLAGLATLVWVGISLVKTVTTPWPPLVNITFTGQTDHETVVLHYSIEKVVDVALRPGGEHAAWVRSDGVLMPVGFTEGGEVGVGVPILGAGDAITSTALIVRVPSYVPGDAGAMLRWCWTYEYDPPRTQCHETLYSAFTVVEAH